MLLVLLAAVALGAERARHRRGYLDRADYHAAEEARLSAESRALAAELARHRRFMATPGSGRCGNIRPYFQALDRVWIRSTTRAAEHGLLKERCLRAASRP
jgi:hypothetical protein